MTSYLDDETMPKVMHSSKKNLAPPKIFSFKSLPRLEGETDE